MFLGFQYPVEIPGVSNVQFLRTALNAQRRARGEAELSRGRVPALAREQADALGLRHGHDEARRERRLLGRREEAQRDGPDGDHRSPPRHPRRDRFSGLDIDALRVVGDGINRIMRKPDKAVLLITHYQRLLDIVEPDFVHVLAGGRIVRSGGPELAHELEREGYAGWRRRRREPARPFPPNREEGWRWSDLSALPDAGRARGRPGACRTTLPWLDCEHEGPRLLFVDGQLDEARSRLGPIAIGPVAVRARDHPLGAARRPDRLDAAARPRPCAARARPDRPCLDRRRRPSRRRDRARRRRPGLGRRDLHRRGLGQPADRHRPRQGRAADAQPAAARRRRLRQPHRPRRASARAPASSSATLAAGGADTPARRRDRPGRRRRLCRGRRRPARARPAAA